PVAPTNRGPLLANITCDNLTVWWLARGFSQYGGLESISWPYQSGYLILAIIAMAAIGISALIPLAEKEQTLG
ncbi:MAG: hypothetical protein AAF485_28160, partial [Chloroflexota bacterium]